MLVLALVHGACERSEYEVRVIVPGDREAVRVEVGLIASCEEVGVPGSPLPSPILLAAVGDGESPRLGGVAGGSYGLAGRAFAEGCLVFAAGCKDVRLEADGEGTLTLELAAIEPRPCPEGERCTDERCVPSEEPELDAGTGDDAGPTREPAVVAQLELDDVITALDAFGDLAAVGISVGGVALVDVGDPSVPRVVATVPTDGSAVSVSLGELLFVIDDLRGILMVDVTTPESPVVFTYAISGVNGVVAPPRGEGRPDAIIVPRDLEVRVYDASNPETLLSIGVWDGWDVVDAAWFGQYGVVVSEAISTFDARLNTPATLESRTFGDPVTATAISVSSSVAWVALGAGGLRAYDLLVEGLPEVATADTTGIVQDVAAARDVVVAVGSAGLEVVDGSVRPSAPVVASVPVVTPSRVALTSGHALVGSGRDLVIVDLGEHAPP